MAKTQTKAEALREGFADFQDSLETARQALEAALACHCCCCTGECTVSFQDSTPEEQAAWMRNYWESWNLS